MTRSILPLLVVLLLAACQRAADTSPQTPSAPEQSSAPAAPAPAPAVQPPAVAEVPVGQCGDQSTAPAEQRIANTPKWSTASEQDVFGFDVYRGESEDGPFERVTKESIQGAGTSDEPHSYSFRDDSIDPCKDYWYYVEVSYTSGEPREKFTPIFRAPAKRRAAE
jgi:pyruvate/2-oxoglutarate dehydrogenase complex dihydrolipoamide acyltransferase (E2) component